MAGTKITVEVERKFRELNKHEKIHCCATRMKWLNENRENNICGQPGGKTVCWAAAYTLARWKNFKQPTSTKSTWTGAWFLGGIWLLSLARECNYQKSWERQLITEHRKETWNCRTAFTKNTHKWKRYWKGQRYGMEGWAHRAGLWPKDPELQGSSGRQKRQMVTALRR